MILFSLATLKKKLTSYLEMCLDLAISVRFSPASLSFRTSLTLSLFILISLIVSMHMHTTGNVDRNAIYLGDQANKLKNLDVNCLILGVN